MGLRTGGGGRGRWGERPGEGRKGLAIGLKSARLEKGGGKRKEGLESWCTARGERQAREKGPGNRGKGRLSKKVAL